MKSRYHQSRDTGAKAEGIVEKILRSKFKLVEKVITPRTKGGVFLRTCSGDFRAITDGGRSVLVEVKYRDRPLRRSDFQDHQRESLHLHQYYGGLSIVAHANRDSVVLTEWGEIERSFSGEEPLEYHRLWQAKLREVRGGEGQVEQVEFQV